MSSKQQYGVSAAHPIAVSAGMDVLDNGGTAVDAAVAVSYMLGVVEPYASGIGGGGVMLVLPADQNDPIVCDYREIAPMSGIVSDGQVGVPGFVQGLEKVHELFGCMELQMLIEPAIRTAEEGFEVGVVLNDQLMRKKSVLEDNAPHLFPDGTPIRLGDQLKQPLLANTMRSIQHYGASWFYGDELARSICSSVVGMNDSDFSRYRATIKKPIYGEYDDYEFIACPPPFGGVTLFQALKTSERIKLSNHVHYSEQSIHLWGEIIGHCYGLRDTSLGDPDFCRCPLQNLISDEMINRLAAAVNHDRSSAMPLTKDDVANTTHFVITDKAGMCVSATNTIGGFFGSGITVGGFFLNNQLSNFNDDAASPNASFPGKRPQSYISPAILRNDEHTIAIGSAGGKRIPMVLSTILTDIVKRKTNIEHALTAPRFFIDEQTVYTEDRLPADVEKSLIQIGYQVVHRPDAMFYGGVHGLMINRKTGKVLAAADPRRGGTRMVRGE